MQFKDYYSVLGVARNASQDEIRKAFRKLARQHHPDVAKDKKAAEGKFKELNEANEVLSDPEKRSKYDQLGADWNNPGRQGPPQGWETQGGGAQFDAEGGFSDFFEKFFGAGGGRRPRAPFGSSTRARVRGGEDLEVEFPVTVEDALHGEKKAFSLSGSRETIEVRIPKGVRAGQKIRLSGQGGAGMGGGTRGDLYLVVSYAPHADYKISGADLTREVSITVFDAVLGGEVPVGTPDGVRNLKIPAGTQPGRKFRIKEHGLPSGPGTRGDFYAEIKVRLPVGLTDEQRALWESLAKRSD